MATGITRPLARSLKGRMFSAASQADRMTADEMEPRCYVKKLENGMFVGTIETNSPVARVAVVANAGARFETGDNLGVSHYLRHAAKLRTENMSSLGITRTSQQLGSDITALSTREYIYYQSNVTRNCTPKMVEVLRELTTKHVFKPWEVNDLQNDPNGMLLDLALLKQQPHVRAMESLHAAAFRNTLGRSLYAPDFMIGKYTPEQLLHYVKTYFGAGRMALIGVGLDQGELEDMAKQFQPYGSAGVPNEKSSYHGGEIRENIGGELSYVAFAFGGPSQTSKDLLPSEVLRHIMGTGPHIKYSSGTATSQLGKAAAQSTDGPFGVKAFNANYSDNGLFGFTAVAHHTTIDQVVRAAANQFKGILTNGVSDADVSRGKTQLKAEMCYQFEHPDALLGWLGEQTLNSDKIITPQEIYKMVDNVTTSDVNNIAKKIVATKPTMSATGNTSTVPYVDKLFS